MDHKPLVLKQGEGRRLRGGHPWVYSNEVDTATTPLTGFSPGDPVEVRGHDGTVLGTGYVNPHTLICARLMSRDAAHPAGPGLLRDRIVRALALRERLYEDPFYRLVYGESDQLPGLVVDRYGEVLVVQFNTAGMEAMHEWVLDALDSVLAPRGILLRNDSGARRLEGLEEGITTGRGVVPEAVTIEEHGTRFQVPVASGQKTGWFFDQSVNRARLRRYAQGSRVLDLFSYIGAWGVQAARWGASEVLCVDSSEHALTGVRENAALNGVAVGTLRADAFDALRELRRGARCFDLVVVDPPAFIKRRKDHKNGLEAYRRLNLGAMELLSDDGILVTCSCSSQLSGDELVAAVLRAGVRLRRQVQILEVGGQAPDHPIHPAIPETGYLKCLVLRVTG